MIKQMRLDSGQIEMMDAVMVPILRARSGAERVQSSLQMFVFGRDLVIASIRNQHPEWTDEQVRQQALGRLHRG